MFSCGVVGVDSGDVVGLVLSLRRISWSKDDWQTQLENKVRTGSR